jgi:hypothetical protein
MKEVLEALSASERGESSFPVRLGTSLTIAAAR